MFSKSGIFTIMILLVIAGIFAISKIPKPTENIWRGGGKFWIADMEEYKKQIVQDPKNAAGALNGLANAYMDQGKIDLAIETYTKAINLSSQFASPYNGRATAYRAKGLYVKAMGDLDKALELRPNYGFAYVNKGLNYFDLGQYDQAIKVFTKAIELNPGYADSYFDRALSYERKGDVENALQDYSKAIEVAPQEVHSIEAYEARAMIYKELGNDKEAIADLDRANLLKLKTRIYH